ncbi:unnamed protein product [Peniophora sp. CBMAI 1063]|nr:unnamed protein product [Peniophora sp. CBMAI 1063]
MGLFEPTVMFFGLTNSPATFQAMMNELFRDLIHESVVVVLCILRENKLYLKPEKCEFEQTKIEYLGMIVEEGHVRMDSAKVKAVAKWAIPTHKKELQSFLGFCNFYRRFIKDFSHVARPLHRLTGDVPWEWGVEQQLAFEELKLRVISEPVLAIPVGNSPFRVEADASDFATGAVLSQKAADGKWHPVEYDFTLHHKPGGLMGRPDALSRKAEHERGENDNQDIVLLKPEFFRVLLRATALDFAGEDEPTIRRIKDCTVKREESVELALLIKNPCWKEHADGLLTHDDRIYVSPDEALRADIIKAHHDSLMAGHPGRYKTEELITRTYWWPSIRKNVGHYVAGCQLCQRIKYRQESPHAPLQPNKTLTRPFEVISMDFVGPLPECEGFNMVLNISDYFSRHVICIPCSDTTDSGQLAQLFYDHVYSKHGLPRKIITDRGSTFISSFTCALMDQLGIVGNPSTAYYLQTDGLTEHYNQELKTFLRLYVDYHQSEWVKYLKLAQFSYNNTVHSSHHETPFHASEGCHPYSGLNPRATDHVPAATSYAQHLKKVHEEIASALCQAKETMKEVYDRHHQDARNYEVGDQVWLEATNLKSKRPSPALNERRHGPFKMLEKIGASVYRLDTPPMWKTHNVFNEALLTPYTPPAFANPPEPPPEMIDGEERYEVEAVINSKIIGRGTHRSMMYLVKWKRYSDCHNSWEPVANLMQDADEAIDDYHKAHLRRMRV